MYPLFHIEMMAMSMDTRDDSRFCREMTRMEMAMVTVLRTEEEEEEKEEKRSFP